MTEEYASCPRCAEWHSSYYCGVCQATRRVPVSLAVEYELLDVVGRLRLIDRVMKEANNDFTRRVRG